MSKRTPGSKAQMKIGKARYAKERERFREKLARKRAESETTILDVLGDDDG